jgi:hypothetical protein
MVEPNFTTARKPGPLKIIQYSLYYTFKRNHKRTHERLTAKKRIENLESIGCKFIQNVCQEGIAIIYGFIFMHFL